MTSPTLVELKNDRSILLQNTKRDGPGAEKGYHNWTRSALEDIIAVKLIRIHKRLFCGFTRRVH